MSDTVKHTSKDGQYGFVRTEVGGNTWQKIRLSDKAKVGEITIPHFTKQARKDKEKDHKADLYGTTKYADSYSQGTGLGKWTQLPPLKAKEGKETAWSSNWCGHDGKTLVWSCDGRDFYCAGSGQIRPADYALVLDLADQVNWRSRWTKDAIILPSRAEFLALNQFVAINKENTIQGLDYIAPLHHKNVVAFNWPDMGIIRTNYEFWDQLWALLPKGKILIACMASHGRTGTCLAALMMASGIPVSALEAVLMVRSMHCENAIEHTNQLQYLDALAEQWHIGKDACKANRVKHGGSADALTLLRDTHKAAAKKG